MKKLIYTINRIGLWKFFSLDSSKKRVYLPTQQYYIETYMEDKGKT